jgi:phage terminase small subunit
MAGVKGRSGGPRKNSGGVRQGAGRKSNKDIMKESANKQAPQSPSEPPAYDKEDPFSYLMSVVNSDHLDEKLRVRAAIAAVQYTKTKRGDGGKKDEKVELAKQAGKGKFGVRPSPLKLVGND